MNKEQIEKQIVDYFDNESKTQCEKLKVKVYFKNNECTVHLSQMYEGVGKFCKFANLQWLSNLLGTEEIDLKNQYYIGGCDSCDYGSSDEVDIVCYNIKNET